MTRRFLTYWCSLLAIGVWAGAAPAQAAPAVEPIKVVGYGQEEKAAKEDALKRAALELAALVHHQRPTVADHAALQRYVEEHLSGPGEAADADPGVGVRGKSWTLTFTSDQASLGTLARKLRGDRRLIWGLWTLPMLVLIIAALAVYLRLQRLTAGRYTPWLRAGSLATAATACTVWWCAKDWLFF